jgi:hypothetical protein
MKRTLFNVLFVATAGAFAIACAVDTDGQEEVGEIDAPFSTFDGPDPWSPGPRPEVSCISPVCKTGCGRFRNACVASCGSDPVCRRECYDEFAECIRSCC